MAAVLDVKVNPQGAVTGAAAAEAALSRLGAKAASVEKGMISLGRGAARLQSAFAALTAGFVAGNVLAAADAYTVVNNRLKLVTGSSEELAAAYDKIYDMAQRTAVPVEELGKFYSQLALNTKALGLTTEKTFRITETLAKVIALSGQSASSSAAALIQLQQAMGAGALRGDELRSIMEQLPMLAQIIADRLGTTVGKLKEFGEQGLITSKIVADAILASSDDIDKAFSKVQFTFSQAFTILYNGVIDTIGKFNEWSKSSLGLTKAIAWVGKEMNNVALAMVYLAGAWTALKIASWIQSMWQLRMVAVQLATSMNVTAVSVTGFRAALMAMNTAIVTTTRSMIAFSLSNPFTALLLGLTLVLPLLYQFRDSIKLSSDGSVTLGTVIKQAFEYLKANWPIIQAGIAAVAQTIWNMAKGFIEGVIPAVQAFWAAVSPIVTVLGELWTALTGLNSSLGTTQVLITAAIGVFSPWMALIYGVIQALQVFDPGLKTTTFLITLMGEAIGLLMRIALIPLVALFNVIVQTMAAFGLVSQETATKVAEGTKKYMDFNQVQEDMETRISAAYDKMNESTTATTKNAAAVNDATNEHAEFWAMLEKGAEAEKKRAEATAAAAVATKDSATEATKAKPVIDTFSTAAKNNAVQFTSAAQAARDYIVALKELQALQSGKPSSGGFAMTAVEARAKGGPVSRNSPYVVGEQGPELFIPDSSGTIIPNGQTAAGSAMTAAGGYKDVGNVTVKASSVTLNGNVTTTGSVMGSSTATVSAADKNAMAAQVTKLEAKAGTANPYTSKREDAAAAVQKFIKERGGFIGGPSMGTLITLQKKVEFYAKLENAASKVTNAKLEKIANKLEQAKLMQQVYGDASPAPEIDFQTLTPNQGGTVFEDKDPFGILSKNVASASNAISKASSNVVSMRDYASMVPSKEPVFNVPEIVIPQQKEKSKKEVVRESPVVVNMTINGGDTQSYRRNMGEIEAGLYAIVKRAKRRANE